MHKKYPELKKRNKEESNEVAVRADNNTLVEEIIVKMKLTKSSKEEVVVNDK